MAVGVKPQQIYIYERFQGQLDQVNYAPSLPEGVNIFAAERANARNDNQNYDPRVYVEADFFGEDDTRSNMMRLVSQKLTKIRSEEHTSELQSLRHLVCRLLLEKKKTAL